MRLLQVGENGGFSLIERVGDSVPPYAILSHTWGADEVTFKDLVDGVGKTKAGYRKINFCGEQAAKDGLQHFWVDTCCIDKSSSAELSEAINSMFRWYRNAAHCYVYLSDVSAQVFDSNDPAFRTAFRTSKWFTRGWTLQELIAPRSVQFFSMEGNLLGDKTSLIEEVATITGVPVAALHGRPLSQFSIDERMSWAEKRQTTREEDAAYCLLGLFNIHMPLLYGEGRRRALRRLRNEIEDSNEVDGLLKWLAPPEFATVYHEYLSEREDGTGEWIFDHPQFCKWLDQRESTTDSARLFWIHGHPGAGKTMLAASVIQRLRSQRHDTSSAPEVFYFFFRHDNPTHTMPVSAYRSILSQFIHRHSEEQEIMDRFSSIIKRGRASVGQAISSEPELIELLKISLASLDCAYIILDGFDECSNIKSLVKVIELLGKLLPVRILIFSRPNIHELVRIIPEKDRLAFDQDEVSGDIWIYLSRSLEDMAREHRLHDDANLEQYVEHLVLGADNMFLWAKLMITYLQSPSLTKTTIERLIWSITVPEGLGSMYDRIFNNIGQSTRHQQELATRILSWVIYSRRELSVEDLQTVVALTSGDDDAICEGWSNFEEVVPIVTCGLVTCQRTNESSSSCTLIHLSASEYLKERGQPTSPISSIDLLRPATVSANLELAMTCLRLLLRAGQPSTGSGHGLPYMHMLPYAAKYWISHLSSSSPCSARDFERLVDNIKNLQEALSGFLTSPKVVATFIEAFYAGEHLELLDRLENRLSRELRTLLDWIQQIQPSSFTDTCPDLQSTLAMLHTFCLEMSTFAEQWECKLVKDPGLIWRDALIFCSTRFLPQSSDANTTFFTPRITNLAGVSSRPLCHISVTSKDTDILGVLSIWPSDRYEKFWRNLDPYLAYSEVESFCTGWTAHYELWSTEDSKQLIFETTIPLEASEIALQMRQAFRHEHESSWKTSFPTAISPDGLTLSILRTLYQFSRTTIRSEPTWKTTILPLDSIEGIRQKWGHDLGVFDPNRSNIEHLPTALRLLHRDWYTYTTTFSPDCRYLLFVDHQAPFRRNLVLFENLSTSNAGISTVSSINFRAARTELRFIIFHPTLPLIAFVYGQSVWTWNFKATAGVSLSEYSLFNFAKSMHTQSKFALLEPSSLPAANSLLRLLPARYPGDKESEDLSSNIDSICFSMCGKYISVTLADRSELIPLDTHNFPPSSEESDPPRDRQVDDLSDPSRGPRPTPFHFAPEALPRPLRMTSPDTVILNEELQSSHLKDSTTLSITATGSLSARTSRIIGTTLVEEKAHLLELPGKSESTEAIIKHHADNPTGQGPSKLSIIFNKTSNIGYDMSEQRTETFPAIVQIHRPQIHMTHSVRPLEGREVPRVLPGLKRPGEFKDDVELRRLVVRNRIEETLDERPLADSTTTSARSGLHIRDLINDVDS